MTRRLASLADFAFRRRRFMVLAWILGWRARPFFAAEPAETVRPETTL